MSSPLELAAAAAAAAAAPPSAAVALLAPVARPRPPISRLLVVPQLPRTRLPRLVGSRRAAAVALHASGKINVRALRALPVAVSYSRGRRAGPPAPVRRLCLRLRCGRLLDEDRVPREVWCFPHPGRPITRSSPVGHFVAGCTALCWVLLPRVGDARRRNGWPQRLAGRPLPAGARAPNVGLLASLCSRVWARASGVTH